MKARQKTTHTFYVDYASDIDDTRYTGSFTSKKLSILDIAALGVRKAQLNGGMYFDPKNPGHGVDPDTDDYNAMIAHLELAIINAPQWWDFKQISDNGLVDTVYREVATFENSFLGRKRRAAEDNGSVGDGAQDSSGSVSPANTVGNAPTMVGEEVLSALEP